MNYLKKGEKNLRKMAENLTQDAQSRGRNLRWISKEWEKRKRKRKKGILTARGVKQKPRGGGG